MTEKIKKKQDVKIGSICLDNIVFEENIRSEYTDADINELAKSMEEFGQLQNVRVHEKNGKYNLIFGHRRCLAAKKAGWENILADVVSNKLDAVDKIYMQAIENEQSKSLSPKDREAYIHSLLEKGESFKKIAQTIGMSSSWVRECDDAYLVREQYHALFDEAGITPGSKDLFALRNASEEQVKEAVALAVENPENKKIIFDDLGKKTKKKMNVGGKSKKNVLSVTGDFKIAFGINFDEDKKTFAIQTKKDVNVDERLAGLLLDVLVSYFADKGYTSLADEK